MTARQLSDLASVGPKTVEDFRVLGIRSVDALAREDADDLYRRLCELRGARIDVCCRDVFAAAIAQARDPALPAEERQWWTWSRRRLASETRAIRARPRRSSC